MNSDELIDELINISWSRISIDSKSKDFIHVGQVINLINELETILQCRSLFTTDELKLLKMMIEDKPILKVYKSDLVKFLLKLVQYADFETFLKERANITTIDLRGIINKPFRKPLSPYNRKYSETAKPISTSTPMYLNSPRPNSRPPISPPLSPIDSRYRSNLAIKEQHIIDRDNEISVISDENNKLSSVNKIQYKKIQELGNEVKNLNSYVESLENQLSKKSNDSRVKDLLDEINQKDRTIKSLQRLCEDSQNELLKFQINDEKNDPIIKSLIENLSKQDQLIENLKSKLDLNNDSSNLKDLLINLPILKQYYLFFKYKQDQKNLGLLIINVVTLLLTTVMLLNIFKFIFYFLIWLFGSKESNTPNYIFDDYGMNWFDNESTFVWWKEIEWLEYLVYRFTDWLHD